MKKKTKVVLWIAIAILIIAGFVWWQMWQLGRGIRTIQAENAQELLLSGMSAQALTPDVDNQRAVASGALLDQYQKDPALIHRRYMLVKTWLNASQIFKTTDWSAFDGKILASSTLTNIPSESRVDGWNSPFCVLVEHKQVAFISSNGTGAPDCSLLRQVAEGAVAASHDARLTRVGNLLVTVQGQTGDKATLAVQ